MSDTELASMTASARLFGRLLVRELDAPTIAELQAPAIAAALRELDIEPPQLADLDELAHEWLRSFLHPEGMPPPVHSLYLGGAYQGDPAVAIDKIAKAAALELATGARKAPVDHIGCILLLWAELSTTRPELAEMLAKSHLEWAIRPLTQTAADCLERGGPARFYASITRASGSLIEQLIAHYGASTPRE